MKLIVLKIIIIVIEFSDTANLLNLRSSPKILNTTNQYYENSRFINNTNKNDNKDLLRDDKLEKINFDYVLLNLNIIEHKIDEFKSKLSGN